MRNLKVVLKVSPEEYLRLDKEALKLRLTLSDYLRSKLTLPLERNNRRGWGRVRDQVSKLRG